LRAHRFAFPPSDEQESIINFLDFALGKINLTVTAARREIALLHEFRTRLIADVVTGKLDIREAAAKLPDESPEPEPEPNPEPSFSENGAEEAEPAPEEIEA